MLFKRISAWFKFSGRIEYLKLHRNDIPPSKVSNKRFGTVEQPDFSEHKIPCYVYMTEAENYMINGCEYPD